MKTNHWAGSKQSLANTFSFIWKVFHSFYWALFGWLEVSSWLIFPINMPAAWGPQTDHRPAAIDLLWLPEVPRPAC